MTTMPETATTVPDPEVPTDLNPSETLVNLLIADHVHLAIHSHSHHDPADPSYDMSLPPATYDEAMQHADAGHWHAAMDK
jgi:hypothetical protein